jgi:hypothetical protein
MGGVLRNDVICLSLEWSIQIISGERIIKTQIKTHRNTDGSQTDDIRETIQLVLKYFAPEYNEYGDSVSQKQVTRLWTRPTTSFIIAEIRNSVENIDSKKSSATNGITDEIYKLVLKFAAGF